MKVRFRCPDEGRRRSEDGTLTRHLPGVKPTHSRGLSGCSRGRAPGRLGCACPPTEQGSILARSSHSTDREDTALPVDDSPEADALRRQVRAELEAEHELRGERLRQRRQHAKARARDKADERRRIEESLVREQVREEFYKEKGYKLYTDSTGRELWLSPEEFEWRQKRHRHGRRKRKIYEPALNNQGRVWLFYVGLLILAIVVGIALAR